MPVQSFPGQPTSIGQIKKLRAGGENYVVYPIHEGVVVHSSKLDYHLTLSLPKDGIQSKSIGEENIRRDARTGICSGINGFFAVWRGRNVYIFEPAYPKELKDEDAYSTTYSSSEHVNWKLHSDIRFAAQVKDARLGRTTALIYLETTGPIIEVWKLEARLGIPLWSRRATINLSHPLTSIALSPCETYVAYAMRLTCMVHLKTIDELGRFGKRGQQLRHPKLTQIRLLRWRGEADDYGTNTRYEQPALFSCDSRNVIRLFTIVVDDPSKFQLVYNHKLSKQRGELMNQVPPPMGQEDKLAFQADPLLVDDDQVSWLDLDHRLRSVTIAGFGAKPPQVLHKEAESVLGRIFSLDDEAPYGEQQTMISLGDPDRTCTLAEIRNNTVDIVLRQVPVQQINISAARQINLGTIEPIDRIWQQLTPSGVITLGAHGECRMWSTDSEQIRNTGAFTIETYNVQNLILARSSRYLLYSCNSIVFGLDVKSGELLWRKDISPELNGSSVAGLRIIKQNRLVVTSQAGLAFWSSLDDNTTELGQLSPLEVERSELLPFQFLPHIPVETGQIGTAADTILLQSANGMLLWAELMNDRWTVIQKLWIGNHDQELLAVAGSRKVACVSMGQLVIWDVEDSIYTNAAEHVAKLEKPVLSLRWSTDSDTGILLLAIGFENEIRILAQGRNSLDELNTAWKELDVIDAYNMSPFRIRDFAFLDARRVLIACSNQLFVYTIGANPTPEAFNRSLPLPDFQRFNLEQCMVWGKQQVARQVLHRLDTMCTYESLLPEDYWKTGGTTLNPDLHAVGHHESGLDRVPDTLTLNKRWPRDAHELDPERMKGLAWSSKQMRAVIRLRKAFSVIDEEESRLDEFSKRYMGALYMRASGPSRPAVPFRYIIWAMHSRRQANLLKISTEYWEDGRLTWTEAKRMGTPFWISDIKTLASRPSSTSGALSARFTDTNPGPSPQQLDHADQIARNEFLTSARDPVACSVFYFALDKKTTVYGLWRQAYGHKEQHAMLKFLANDFSTDRWRSAALKNAYALLGKQRFQYAAAFFILAGQPADAIRICLKELDDLEMAIMIARLADYRASLPDSAVAPYSNIDRDEDKPIPVCGKFLRQVIEDVILLRAKDTGDRWMSHWGLWNLGKRSLAIRHLTLPLEISGLEPKDSSSALRGQLSGSADWVAIYYELRQRYFKDVAGEDRPSTEPIANDWLTREEELFMVKHRCKRLWDMGFWSLSLSIMRDWQFVAYSCRSKERAPNEPSSAVDGQTGQAVRPTDVETETSKSTKDDSSRNSSGKLATKISLIKEESQFVDSSQSQGATEFDMSSFF